MANSDVYYNVSNAHYYQWVPAGGITWQQAKILAEDAKLNGIAGSYLTGYLATITTPEELRFIDEVVFASGRPANTYIGGSDAAQEGVWRWVTGPEGQANDGAGTVFFASGEYVGEKAAEWQNKGQGDSAELDYLYIYSWWEPKFIPWPNDTGSISSGGPAGYLIEWGLSQGTPNNDPTGSVRIVGNARPGETVFVDVSDVTDPDGFGRFVHYSWYLNGENINWTTTNPLATDYPIFASDIGKILTVEYSYYDGEGHLETVISDAVEITTVNQNPRLVAFDFSEFMQQTGASVTAPADGFEFLVVIVDGIHYALPYIGEKNGVLLFGDAAASFQSGNVESAYFLARTTDSASFTDSLDYRNSLIRSEFGSLATHADWFDLEGVSTLMSSADLVDYIDISPFPSDSNVGDGAFVTVNGVTNFSSNRAYHIGAHEGTLRASWLIHDTIDNHQIDLGSYNITELLLAKISIPSTFLTLASGPNVLNDAPTVSATIDLGSTPEDVARTITSAELLLGATDADGDTLSVANLTASSGSLVNNNDGTWNWTPAANDTTGVTFSYNVTDGTASVAQTATLDLTPVDNNPNRFYWDPAVGGNGHYYEFVNSDVTWDAAFRGAALKTYAGQLGYLVTVTSDDEFNFIISKMNSISVGWNAETIWVGASDANSEGTFFWMNGPEAGTEFIETDWGWPAGYSGWKPGDDYLSIDVVSNVGYFLTLDQEWFKNGSRTWENGSRYSNIFEGNGYVVEYSPNYTTPPNNDPTGSVRILGDVAAGNTVVVDVSDVTDADGFGRFVHYSWYLDGVNLGEGRTTTSNPLAIEFPIYASDVGKILTVEYSYYDGEGHLETVVSEGVVITPSNEVPELPVQFFANTAFRHDSIKFGDKSVSVDYETLQGDEIVEITADEAYQEIYEGYDLLPEGINRDSNILITEIVHYNDRFSAYSKDGISFSYPTATSGTFNHFGFHKDYVTYGDGLEWFVANVMVSASALDASVSTTSTADDVEFFASVFAGNDEVYLSQFADSFDAGAGNDLLYGFGGNDTLNGGDGTDTINGGTGTDILIGGGGADVMCGGEGDDVYHVGSE
jgi:Ca2+-binding RTX toxin-like protein